MGNAIALRQTSSDLISFDDKKRALIRTTLARDLDNNEFDLFISIASARGLDPVLNQIHAVKRAMDGAKKMVIQIGIDGYRLTASRTGEHAGTDEPEFTYNSEGKILKSKVTVYRMVSGMKCHYVGIAHWDEFFPGEKQGFMWRKMPHNQLAKCAEAQALRKAFPGDLGGTYIPEELEREVIDVSPGKEESGSSFDDDAKTKQMKDLLTKFQKLGVTELNIVDHFEIENMMALTEDQIKELNKLGSDLVNKRKTIEEAFSKKF